MSKIIIGSHNGKDVGFDLDLLLATRLLVQAGSGGGKSWLLRRLMEQAFGKVQIICIDPEGEFSTLREKYAFVLAGKGGESTVDPRAAGLLAERLLQLKAPAICDIYELKSHQRHAFVRTFLEALVNAPKDLWHPVLVIVDEAHVFCPEKGQGESEAYGAMVDLATRGRKRGFAAIFATQRLGKLSKNASAELTNRLIGPTFEDVDRKRAAELLGIAKADEREFSRELQVSEFGNFFALGRAISTDCIRVTIGPVSTSHPEVGKGKLQQHQPPTPDAIKGLLPQLADLPKEAEEKARTEADLRKEIANLKRELTNTQKATPQADPRALEAAVAAALQRQAKEFNEKLNIIQSDAAHLRMTIGKISNLATLAGDSAPPAVDSVTVTLPPQPPRKEQFAHSVTYQRQVSKPQEPGNGSKDITGPMQRILDAIAWMESIGIEQPKQAAVAFLAGYTVGGGAFNNPRGALRQAGLIDYRDDALVLTAAGRQIARAPDSALTQEELHQRVLQQLPGPEQSILRPLLDSYPDAIENDALAQKAGYTPGGGAFNNPRGRLRTLGLVEYPQKGMVKAADLLFIA